MTCAWCPGFDPTNTVGVSHGICPACADLFEGQDDMPTPTTIRWRLNDPTEGRYRWTRVHRVSLHAPDLTACHILIPDDPYMTDRDDQIPTGAPTCKRCANPDHREA